jgi:hypothetical protein
MPPNCLIKILQISIDVVHFDISVEICWQSWNCWHNFVERILAFISVAKYYRKTLYEKHCIVSMMTAIKVLTFKVNSNQNKFHRDGQNFKF